MDVAPLQPRRVKADDLPLDRLAANSRIPESEKIATASRAFEALLLQQILQEAQRPVFKSKYASDSTTNGIYRDMAIEQLANGISKSSSLGLAQSLASGLQPHPGPRPVPGRSGLPSHSLATLAAGAHDPLVEPKGPPPLRSPKDAANHPLAPAPPSADVASPPERTRISALPAPSAAPPLSSPKMKDTPDRKERAPSALHREHKP